MDLPGKDSVTSTSYGGLSPKEEEELSASKEAFKRKLTTHFQDLVSRGVSANDAAALALKLASGTAEKPLDLAAFLCSLDVAKRSGNFQSMLATISDVFSSTEALNSSFLLPPSSVETSGGLCSEPAAAAGSTGLSIDFNSVKRFYSGVMGLGQVEVDLALMGACDRLLQSLLNAASEAGGWPLTGNGLLRQMLILLENPFFVDPNHHGVLVKLMRVISSQHATTQEALSWMFHSYTREQMEHIVSVVQQFVTIHLYESQQIDDSIEAATKLLSLLHDANLKSGQLSFTEFYNDAVNNEEFNIKEDYRRWKQPERYSFAFCQFPFIYDPSSKSRILQLESTMKMSNEFEDAVLRSIFIGATCPYLVLKVRREHLIPDTLAQISRRAEDLKKPLKVHFVGEEGVDEGGVQKEFFQLLIRQLFDPNYCMFSYDDDTRLFWFKASPLDLSDDYELIGIVIGLAIFNGHILEFRFPMVTYKKLMGYEVSLEDLKEVAPIVYRSFRQLLDYPGDVKSHFDLTFQVSYEVLGEVMTEDLVENAANTPVTNANKEDYVNLHARFILESSIERQFLAFKRGFARLCSGPVLQLFRPEELEQLICGSPELDFEALERHTQYDDGYTQDSEVIRAFWSVVHSLSEENKKKLLFFATGSDRVPIKGLGNLPFVISRNGEHSDRLPTAHTCFNHLLLPEYNTEETLRERLMTAINNAEGFGLM